jgi:hypothetical protein
MKMNTVVRVGLIGMGIACVIDGGRACGQSINIDFGTPGTIPEHTYGAAARQGAWNSFESLPTNQRFPLVNLYGQPIGARIYNNGGTNMLSFNNAGTQGGDEALMDDMLLSFNNPVDACIWIENVLAGTYEVTTYAMTPNDPLRLSRVRVDFATPGPIMVGGAWPGMHVHGITHARHTVTVSQGGTIGLHSGLFGGNIQSGINGIQIVRLADCPADWNSSGGVNSQDFFEFLSDFFALAGDYNFSGATDSQDLFDFLVDFFGGC